MTNLKSFSVDTQTGKVYQGARKTRIDPERYVHMLLPDHEIARLNSVKSAFLAAW
jgi:hypothetical protein